MADDAGDTAPDRNTTEAASHDVEAALLQATGEDRIRLFLKMAVEQNTQDWTSTIMPHVTVLSSTPAPPHPRVLFQFDVGPQHGNKLGNLHGGCAATVFDQLTSMPLALVGRPGYWSRLGVSRSLSVTYLRPVPVGRPVLVECEILHVGRRLATLRGVMRRKGDGAILALCEHLKFNTDPPPSKV